MSKSMFVRMWYVTAFMAALALGVRAFDSSVSGLGGCPFAKGVLGNVATEELAYLLNGLGHLTGVDPESLIDESVWISRALHREPRFEGCASPCSRSERQTHWEHSPEGMPAVCRYTVRHLRH